MRAKTVVGQRSLPCTTGTVPRGAGAKKNSMRFWANVMAVSQAGRRLFTRCSEIFRGAQPPASSD